MSLKYFVNQVNCTLYAKNKLEKSFSGACFGNFSRISAGCYKAHYHLNNDLKKNEKLIRTYFSIWNQWKPTKNWFNVDKIIADNGFIWNFNHGLHKANTKICILRFIDEKTSSVDKLIYHYNNKTYPTIDKLIVAFLNTFFGSGHSFVYGGKANLSMKKDTKQFKESRSQRGINDAWNAGYLDKYEPIDNFMLKK